MLFKWVKEWETCLLGHLLPPLLMHLMISKRRLKVFTGREFCFLSSPPSLRRPLIIIIRWYYFSQLNDTNDFLSLQNQFYYCSLLWPFSPADHLTKEETSGCCFMGKWSGSLVESKYTFEIEARKYFSPQKQISMRYEFIPFAPLMVSCTIFSDVEKFLKIRSK